MKVVTITFAAVAAVALAACGSSPHAAKPKPAASGVSYADPNCLTALSVFTVPTTADAASTEMHEYVPSGAAGSVYRALVRELGADDEGIIFALNGLGTATTTQAIAKFDTDRRALLAYCEGK